MTKDPLIPMPAFGPFSRHRDPFGGGRPSLLQALQDVTSTPTSQPFNLSTSVMYVNHKAKTWVSLETVDPEVQPFHQRLPEFAETPLRQLTLDYCHSLGVRQVYVKDESTRCGLPAFKILGASWGAYRAIVDHLKCSKSASLDHIRHHAREADICLYTATDGNHGRAVARFARVLGVKASVYVPQIMQESTKDFISQEGASVTVVNGDYDDAVRAAERRSEECNGILVQDTAWPGYEEIPRVSMGSPVTRLSMTVEGLQRFTTAMFHLLLPAADCT